MGKILTTKDIKLEARDPNKEKKLDMVTTNETKPKGFKKPKGKAKVLSSVEITTGNIEECQKKRKKELVQENRSFKIRQKKLEEAIKAAEEKRSTETLSKEEHIDMQIAALQQKKMALKGI